MLYKNTLKLTNSKGQTHYIRTYSNVSVRISANDPIKSANIQAEFITNREILLNHQIGSTVEIFSEPEGKPQLQKRLFYGVVANVPKVLDGSVKKITFDAKCLLSKTQKILINETYEEWSVDQILNSLLKYTNFFDHINIPLINAVASFEFKDEYLYDAIKKVCEAVGYTFTANDKTFEVYLDLPTENPVPIEVGDFEAGSASFNDDDSKLVNHIRAYGGMETTPFYKEETFIANGEAKDFYLTYSPSDVEVYVDDVRRTLGVLYLHSSGYDCYMDYDQKLIQFVNAPAANLKVRVKYKYKQRIVVEETDGNSIDTYGLRMEKMELDYLTSRSMVRDYIRDYIAKYKDPLTMGSLTPLYDKWGVRELIMVDIPDINVQKQLVSTGKTITLTPSQLKTQLSFEQKTNLVDILKNHLDRIRALEKQKEDPEAVDKYRSIFEKVQVEDIVSIKTIDRNKSFIIGLSTIGNVI